MSKTLLRKIALVMLAATLLAACGGSVSTPASPAAEISPTSPCPSSGAITKSLVTPQPSEVLIELTWEGGFTRPELAFAFGRVPEFSLLPDGSVFYVDPSEWDKAQVMLARLIPAERDMLVQRVLDLGFERLESYTDACQPQPDGTCLCVADAGESVLRVRLSDGGLREIRNYYTFANDPEALMAIRTLLEAYRHDLAEPFTPDRVALFIRPLPPSPDLPVLDWPLSPSWLSGGAPDVSCAKVLSGGDLTALLAVTGRNMGDFYFRVADADQVTNVYLAPWLPNVDYAGLIASSGQACAPMEAPRSLLPLDNAEWAHTSSESEAGTLERVGPDEALRRDAEAYAQQFGVTVEEATARLQFQDGIGELNAALQANEADTFGGLWIEHEPDFGVVALFTRLGEGTIQPYLANKPYAHLVEVRQARYTLAELETINTQATRELAKLDFGVNIYLHVQHNRVEVQVSDRAWFESELRRVGAQLPQGVELVVIEGGSTARDMELLLTPPVPGIAFPRQKPTEGFRICMTAALVGTLQLEDGCLYVQSLGGGRTLPIWPPEFTLRVEGDQALVIDGTGQVAARAGEEVYMGGGEGAPDAWALQQVPASCRGAYFMVGCSVRPNLRHDSELFAVDVISDGPYPPDTARTVLFLRYKPALDEQVVDPVSTSGNVVTSDYNRCLHLQTGWASGPITLLWPANWSARVEGETVIVLDGTGRAVARMGDEVHVRGREVPHSADVPLYRQLIDELPGDCVGPSWLVDSVE